MPSVKCPHAHRDDHHYDSCPQCSPQRFPPRQPSMDAPDVVNKPAHYTSGGIECIDYLKAKLSREGFKGFLRGNVLKYLSRAGLKSNELEDLRKAAWYLERLIREGE